MNGLQNNLMGHVDGSAKIKNGGITITTSEFIDIETEEVEFLEPVTSQYEGIDQDVFPLLGFEKETLLLQTWMIGNISLVNTKSYGFSVPKVIVITGPKGSGKTKLWTKVIHETQVSAYLLKDQAYFQNELTVEDMALTIVNEIRRKLETGEIPSTTSSKVVIVLPHLDIYLSGGKTQFYTLHLIHLLIQNFKNAQRILLLLECTNAELLVPALTEPYFMIVTDFLSYEDCMIVLDEFNKRWNSGQKQNKVSPPIEAEKLAELTRSLKFTVGDLFHALRSEILAYRFSVQKQELDMNAIIEEIKHLARLHHPINKQLPRPVKDSTSQAEKSITSIHELRNVLIRRHLHEKLMKQQEKQEDQENKKEGEP